ncbi:MAG TPA: Hsp20/alpha crystallin family protein [bacterium]|nr:Hsp20/alpha crystallin family protein [bacterium]HPN42683.1 Hsp20/alpha crystallin family protein [bacterium]
MPIQLIHVIREITDTVSFDNRRKAQAFCADIDHYQTTHWEPNTDIIESEDEVIIKIEMAGVKHGDVSVKVRNGKLLICGERREKLPHRPVSFHQLEISYGMFEKAIVIPEILEHNNISATLGEGILEIVISKKSDIVEIPIHDRHGVDANR